MCGIAGFQGDFKKELLAAMSSLIAHRGPDDAGDYITQENGTTLGLAHRRLAIIDLSQMGHQPMWDPSKSVAITYNGEIYNFKQLRGELEKEGFQFRSSSDTEVLIALYLRYGADMLPLLKGIFAFAIWDRRSDSLFLARDQVGVKPLYFCEYPRGFIFASEMKALLADSRIPRELDPQVVQNYLTYLWCPAPRTMLQAVNKLEPGYALLVQNGRIQKKWQYYDLPYDQPIAPLSEAQAAEELQTHLKTAVSRQMVSDVPVGAFLSGGLDSSSVIALAGEQHPGVLTDCYTSRQKDRSFFEEGFVDDWPYARKVANHLKVSLNAVAVGRDMISRLEEMLYLLDEPQADPAPLNALLICEAAAADGLKVLLSGAGGDDILTGYRRHYALCQEKYWGWLPLSVRKVLAAAAARVPVGGPVGRRLNKAFRMAHSPENQRVAGYFHWNQKSLRNNLYSAEMQNRLANADAVEPLLESLARLPDHVPPLNRMLYLEGKHFLADHNLNYTDRMGMATGVEVRVPLLDVDLIDFCARLPLSLKQNGRTGKYLFKKSMTAYLPADVIWRKKAGFGAPIRTWIKNDLNDRVADLLSARSLNNRGLFQPKAVRELIAADRQGNIDGAYTIFALLCIELWCRLFVDKPLTPRQG